MKKYIWSLLGFLCLSLHLVACDACGVSTSTGMGQLAGIQYSLLSVGWQQTTFTDHHDLKDVFSTMRLTGQIYISPKVRLLASQGFAINTRHQYSNKIEYRGLTDLQVGGFVQMMKNKRLFKTGLLDMDVGASLLAPTGRHDKSIVLNRNLPENFNPGRDNWGGQFSQLFRLKMFNTGILLVSNQTFFTASKRYTYGNQYSAELIASKDIIFKQKHILIPMLGTYVEYLDKDRYADGSEVRLSGGKGWQASAGFNAKFANKMVVGMMHRFPLTGDYTQGTNEHQGNWEAHITYIF